MSPRLPTNLKKPALDFCRVTISKMKDTKETVEIFSLPLWSSGLNSFTAKLRHHLLSVSKLKLLATPNPEQVVLASYQPEFFKALSRFDWLVPDGVGLVKASCWLKSRGKLKRCLKERVTGVDVVSWLFGFAVENGLKVLLVGGRNLESLELKIKNVKLKIIEGKKLASLANRQKVEVEEVGDNHSKNVIFWVEGYRDKLKPTKMEEQMIDHVITELKPDIVLVALGAPEQEFWLIQHHEFLDKAGVKLGMVVGGAVDMLSGRLKRAPLVWQRLGLEWLWRLAQEPWRWRRQLRLVRFVWLVIRYPRAK